MLEKLQSFASGKYETAGTAEDIENAYHARTTDALERIDALQINKRIASTGKFDISARSPNSALTVAQPSCYRPADKLRAAVCRAVALCDERNQRAPT
jgi:amphiphysin